MHKITLLIHCKDRSGIIASVTNFIAQQNGNIVYIDQHVDREQGLVCMRLVGDVVGESCCCVRVG
jgi:formyltetrahydrofolate deformylase